MVQSTPIKNIGKPRVSRIDFNVVSQEPFRDSAREIFGEYSCYPLLAVGTLKEKSAFKLYAGVKGIDPQVANDITTQIDNYNEDVKNADEEDKGNIDIHDYITDPKHYQIYKESIPYQSIIEQAKVHACGFGLFNGNPRQKNVIGYGDLRYEIGLIRCRSKSTGNTTMVLNIEGGLLDSLGFVKDDFLIVDVVGLINEFYASIGEKVPTFNELKELVKNDKATWDIYAKGATCCINQVEKTGSTMKVMKYKPHDIAELSMFIAAIRPGFASLIDNFLARKYYTTGQKEIDQVLNDTNHYMIYQESIMKVLGYLGLPMSDTYGVIKSISKKKLKGEKKDKLLSELKESWRDKFGDIRKFDSVWQVISDSARYSFNCLSGDTKIVKPNGSPNNWYPTIEEMYLIKNDIEYAKKTGHINLHSKYKSYGYGYGLSMKDGRIWQNKIIDIYKKPDANVFKVTTESGRSVRATANHKFPTKDGIKTLDQLKVGDVLYYKGDYIKKEWTYNLTDGNVTNIPQKGQMGFQKHPNGASIIYNKIKTEHQLSNDPCALCGKPYNDNERFELHHKDFHRKNNTEDNYQWLCCSCHKKIHYEHGRNKRWDKGCLAIEDPIISIEPDGVETVYDVEMSGEVAHNFVINGGLVVCNCSHAYSMAGDSLYGAYFKAHYPDKFYEVAMNHYHKKNNKNKIFDLESEAKKFYGYNVAPMRYGQNNVKFSVDPDKKAIYSPLDSIKDIGMNAAEDMAKISDKHYQSFVDIIASCKGTKVNSKVIGKLLDIDYFEKFGTSKYLSKKYELVKQFYGKKQLSKADYDMSELIKDTGDSVVTDLMKSGKRSDKRYQIVDSQKLIEYMSKSIPKEDFSIGEKIKRQYEALGFTDVTNECLDWRFAVVTGINDKYSVKVDLYCVNNGKTTTFKVRKTKGRDVDIKTTWNQCPLQLYDMIHIDGHKKQKKMTNKDGKWVPSGEYEWLLTEYSVIT